MQLSGEKDCYNFTKETKNKSVKYNYQITLDGTFILKEQIITTENYYISLFNNYHL